MIFTDENRLKLQEYLATHELPSGIGTKESACSIAAINLAISGKLTDDIPPCMSLALGRATITLQDAIPHDMRNSERFKSLLPHMAGTGRDREQERADVLIDWMWSTVLPAIQHVADAGGFGNKWRRMCTERTLAYAGAAAARAAYAGAAAYAANAASDAANAAANAAYAGAAFWRNVDPIGVLERATFLGAVGAPQ